MLKSKVYILDYELISPLGIGTKDLAANLAANRDCDLPIKRFDTSGIPFKNAAEIITDLNSLISQEADYIKDICTYDRMLELLAATVGKFNDRLDKLKALFDPQKTGVILGIGADVTPFEFFENELINYLEDDNNAIVELFTTLNKTGNKLNRVINPYDAYAVYLAQKFNAAAFQRSVLTACVSSTQALAMAYESIHENECEVVIAGGTDSLINTLATIAFGKLGVIAETTDDKCCKPFDLNRNGTLAGEAAGFAILASEDFVKKHQLKPKAEFLGYGNTLDAYKITAPDPEGTAITKAIEQALHNSGLKPSDVDYINAHGTGTKHNDHLELKCLKKAFGQDLKNIPISSTKSRHGHAIAAAGIQELCVVLETMESGLIPGNLNLTHACETDLNLPTENKTKKVNIAITNNFAFGGINTVLAIKNMM